MIKLLDIKIIEFSVQHIKLDLYRKQINRGILIRHVLCGIVK